MILAGRKINDEMGIYVANQVTKLINKKGIVTKGAKILIMGLAFKENCPDIRNSRIIDLVKEFKESGYHVDVYDPWVDKSEAMEQFNIKLIDAPLNEHYDAIILHCCA